MREKTIVALYDRFEQARMALEELVQSGVPQANIAVLSNNADSKHPEVLSNPSFALTDLVKTDSDASSAPGFLGAEIGAGIGGLLGLLVGIGTIAIPGIGPVIAAGWWVPLLAGAGAGAVVGGGIGVLTDHGVEEADAHLYAEGLRRGGTLVTVHIAEDRVDDVTRILKTHGAVDVEKRSAAWKADGWVSFDANAAPLSPEEIIAHRERTADGSDAGDDHHGVRHYFKPEVETEHLGGVSNQTTHYAEDQIRRT